MYHSFLIHSSADEQKEDTHKNLIIQTMLLFTEAFALFYANKNNTSITKVNIPSQCLMNIWLPGAKMMTKNTLQIMLSFFFTAHHTAPLNTQAHLHPESIIPHPGLISFLYFNEIILISVSLVVYSPWGRKELDTTERLTLSLFSHSHQRSYLESHHHPELLLL